jgi:hypothetical protein
MILRYAAYEEVGENLREVVKDISQTLTSNRIPHAVVGGIAMGTYISGRTTQDIDILVDSRSKQQIKRLFPGGKSSETPSGKLPIWSTEHLGIEVDFLFADGLPSDALSDPTIRDGVPVISQHALTALKVRSGRPKDLEDMILLIRSELEKHPEIQKYYLDMLYDKKKPMSPEKALNNVLQKVLGLKKIKDYLATHDLETAVGERSEDVFKGYLEEALIGLNKPFQSKLKQNPSSTKKPSEDEFDDLGFGEDDLGF